MNPTRMAQHQWDSSLDPEIVPLFLHLQWAHARSLDEMRPLLAHYQLSAAELDVLATLRNAPAPYQLTPSQIQDDVVITSGGLTKVMLQLEQRGLVERPPHTHDQRSKPVQLTPTGIQHIEHAMQDMVHNTGEWVRQRLSPEETHQLTQLLGKLVD